MRDELKQTAQLVIERARQLDGDNLDAAARLLGAPDFEALARGARFDEVLTGGGCSALRAALPGRAVELYLTDGECCSPHDADTFFVGVGPDLDTEDYGLTVHLGRVVARDGRLVDEGRLPIDGSTS